MSHTCEHPDVQSDIPGIIRLSIAAKLESDDGTDAEKHYARICQRLIEHADFERASHAASRQELLSVLDIIEHQKQRLEELEALLEKVANKEAER